MAYRVGVHASTGKSPYKVMFGLHMRMPVHLLTQPYDDIEGDADLDDEVQIEEDTRPYEEIFNELENVRELIHQSCAANISTSQARQVKDYDARHRGAPLQVGDLIMNYNTKAKQRKGDRMAPNWTGPYTIIKVHSNGNYTVKNLKGEVLATKMCASNVKLWQQPTDWENEPAPDWISAQQLDDTESIVKAAPVKKGKRKCQHRHDSPEPSKPWIPPPTCREDSSSEESDYEGEPPVKKAEHPSNVKRSNSPLKDTAQQSKKVRFSQDTSSRSVLPPSSEGIDQLKTILNAKVKKKRSMAEQRERKNAERMFQKKRKDDFFQQMLHDDLVSPPSLPQSCSDSDDVTVINVQTAGDNFIFLPLVMANRKAVCDRVSLIMRKMNIPHSQVGEKLGTQEPCVTRVKGDSNCLFRALCMAVTGWEAGHMKI